VTPEPTPSSVHPGNPGHEQIRATVLDVLARIAPELDPASLAPGTDLRAELDLDSMDFLNFAVGLHGAFGIDIPESDYRELATLGGCIDYVAARTGG
jgi:acyl carrier protein